MTIVGGRRPELQSVRYGIKMYGLLSGNGHGGNGMVWALDDHTIVVVQNSPGEPDGVRRSVYPVTDVAVSNYGLTATTDTGTLSVTQAPCTCGAGPTATAYPATQDTGKKIDLQPVTAMPEWIRRV